MKNITFPISVIVIVLCLTGLAASKPQSDVNAKIAQLDIQTAALDDVIRIFGEPTKYVWGNQTFTKDNLPSNYIAFYPSGFSVYISGGQIRELRHTQPGYVFRGKLQVGSSLDEVLEVIGQPTETVQGQPNQFKDGVLYKDIDGKNGYCYYGRSDQGVRFFFRDYKVIALYVTRSDFGVGKGGSGTSKPASDINAKVAQLDIDTATLDDVIRIFGEPVEYKWAGQTYTKNNLPRVYITQYPNKFSVVMVAGQVDELRFESLAAGYVFRKKIRIGSSLDEVLKVVGQPTGVIEGQAMPRAAKDGVLYKDINGRKGYCHYGRADRNVRFFFLNYKVSALYITRSRSAKARGRSSKTIQPVTSVKEFDDVRWKDLSKLDLSYRKGLTATLTFNQKTVWPEATKIPPGRPLEKLLKDAMNPGLGIRRLHRQGITGKGVNVAIIDQPLYLDHPEFAGKIVAYHDVGCGSKSSMHGPAVASLLVGTNCGTAPDAKVYYVAAPSWTKDSAYQAKALDWIVEQNKTLSALEKIRVVSVSAAPSGRGSPFEKNQQMWDQACARAQAAGILVLDCTSHHGFIGPCWYDARFPENVAKCTPGFPARAGFRPSPERVLVPTCPRTTAEEYDKGDFSYQYYGRGGLSWAIPYCAGVLALGWQINPDLRPEQMRELLFKSAYRKKNGAKIINPGNFIRLVKRAKVTPRIKRKTNR